MKVTILILTRMAGKYCTIVKDQSGHSIKSRGTMMGRILIPLTIAEKDELTFLIGLVGPMRGNILQNAFKSSWEYFLSFGWLT